MHRNTVDPTNSPWQTPGAFFYSNERSSMFIYKLIHLQTNPCCLSTPAVKQEECACS